MDRRLVCHLPARGGDSRRRCVRGLFENGAAGSDTGRGSGGRAATESTAGRDSPGAGNAAAGRDAAARHHNAAGRTTSWRSVTC